MQNLTHTDRSRTGDFKTTTLSFFIKLFLKSLIYMFLSCLFSSDSDLENNNIQVVEARAFYRLYKIHTM